MVDTSGFSHYRGINLVGTLFGGSIGSLDRSKVDERLIAMYNAPWPPHRQIFILPAHVTFDEKEGYVDPIALREISYCAPNLITWSGHGKTGETFGLDGALTREQLEVISTTKGVKFVWLLEDRSKWTYRWLI